jgi:hypothetical protein
VLLGVAAALGSAATARAADCSLADDAYNGACGPQFEQPAWGDGAGWTDPSKYSTIQLADLTGNGVDELIARNDDGIEIWRFDTTLGQWRPAIGANGQPEVLTDFRSPLPSESGPNWNQAQYYKTIQTADLTGNGAHEIIARFPDGMRVYRYAPPAGTKSIDGGTWSVISKGGPFSDADGYTDPSLYLTIHAVGAENGQPAQLVAQAKSGVVLYDWNGSGWTKHSPAPLGPYEADPSSYLALQMASLPSKTGVVRALIERYDGGVVAQYENAGKWQVLGAKPSPGPFADAVEAPNTDCPFETDGPTSECFGSSPSYYETLRFADIDGKPGEEMLGRTSDGLRMYKLASDGSKWSALAKLTDLGGSAFDSNPPPPGRWASIRTADIGPGSSTEVLALDGTGLQAWAYDATADKWSKLAPPTPLNLGGKTWDTDASYYSTIQAGDVTGSGHEAVIARGPFGIRTWFYDLHGDSGWTSYLPQDTSSYPQFAGGRAAAFAALNAQAKSHGAIPSSDGSVRDVWTGENAPSRSDLSALQQAILGFAGCSGSPNGSPPYAACTPPAGTSGFSGADWTAVVNEVLAEIGLAGDTDDFFAQLDTLRQKTFIAQGAELDAIAAKLGVQGAAGNETTVKPAELTAGILKILGALAGNVPVAGEALATALETAGELVGLMASDSPTLNSEFSARYADLKDRFATMITEIDKGLEVQSQEVRSSYNLMSLVAQLTTGQGPWRDPDTIGLESANDQGFAQWVYSQLLPTMYVRYHVSGCELGDPQGSKTCGAVDATKPGMLVESQDANHRPVDFDMIGLAPFYDGYDHPCSAGHDIFGGYNYRCYYEPLPGELGGLVWGHPSETCDYRPGNANTKWVYGCNVGVNPERSISLTEGPANGWQFTDYCGSPAVAPSGNYRCASGGVTLGAGGRVTVNGTLPAGFNKVTSASIELPQLLHQASHLPQLVDTEPGVRASGPLRLSLGSDASQATSASAGEPSGRLSLGPVAAAQRRFSLSVTGVSVGDPAACQELPASDALATPTVALSTAFVLSDEGRHRTVSVPSVWHCVRDRAEVITKLAPVVGPRPAQRPGLSVSLSVPRRVARGTTAFYRVTVSNRRTGQRNRLISSLWHVLVDARVTEGGSSASAPNARATFAELPRGRTRTLSFRARISRSARGQVCVTVTAAADSARPAAARRCARVVSPPRGLG